MQNLASSRSADTHVELHPLLAERWSPRSFDRTIDIDDAILERVLEAARWSPSASNSQPWHFAVGRRGDAVFTAITEALADGNRLWADQASVLIVAVAELPAPDRPAHWASYDVGQAVAHLSIQAQHEGLATHQMAGFSPDAIRAAFGLDEGTLPLTVTALGVAGTPDDLPDALREREVAPRVRRPLRESLLNVA